MATTVPSLITDHGETPAMQKSASNSPHITRKVTDVSRNSSVLTNRTRKSTLKELSPSELLADGTSGWVCPGIDNLIDTSESSEKDEANGKKDDEDTVEERFDDGKQSPWGSLWMCNFVQFLCGIQFAIYFTSMWPYLSTLDHSADLAFLGVIVAVFSVGQTIASPVFGFWSQKTRSVRYPSIVGVILTAFGNVLYAMLPTIKTNAKWYMLVSRVIVGVGAGNLGVLRAYTSTASSAKDRNKAMALGIASFVIGQSVGPGMQALFTPIGEEGIWIGTVQLNVYTVPAYVMILLSIVSSFLLMFCFTESYAGIMETDEDSDPYLVIPKFDKIAASVLIYMWYVQQSIVTTIEVLASPLTIAMFNWNDDEAVLYNGIILTVSCVFSMVNYFAIAYTRVGRLGKRRMILISLVLFMIYYLLNMPWPFYPESLDFIQVNGTYTDVTKVNGGCYDYYKWCAWTKRTPIYVYIFCATVLFGVAFPYFATPSGTIFSHVLGPRNQGFMQGIFALFGSIARTIQPLVTTYLFEHYGYMYPNIVQFVQLLIAFILASIFYRRLVPLLLVPKTGESAKYKRGTFWRL